MTSSMPLARRVRAGGLVIALAAGGAILLPAAPASAVTIANSTLNSSVSFGNSGPTCTETGPGDAAQGPLAVNADGVAVSTSTSSSATYTHNVNAADITTLQASTTGTAKATAVAGVLSTLDFSSTGAASVNSALGASQACDATANTQAVFQLEFDLPAPRVLVLDADSSSLAGQFVVQNSYFVDPIEPVVHQEIDISQHSQATRTMYLPAGKYQIGFGSQQFVRAPEAAGAPTSRSGSLTMHAELLEPGVAQTEEAGAGKKYVDLGSRSCAAGSLPVTFTNRAGKGKNRTIKKATFFVNDAKVKSVRKPKKKAVTTLTGLDPKKDVTVEVRLKLVKKGKVTVERDYLRCV